MDKDLLKFLKDWEYDPDSNVRKIVGEDGVQKIQVRVDQGAFQGILQLNLDGRPDGKRPHDSEFALDHYRETLTTHRLANAGQEDGFQLDRECCQELFDEGARVYGRYVFLLQLKDYDRVIKDTERNMELFRFVHCYATHEDDRMNLQKWWPYVLRINVTARAMLAAKNENFEEALDCIQEVREEIEDLSEVEAEEFFVEKKNSLEALDELEEELRESKPLSEEEQLQRDLDEAVKQEDFERAAFLRDQIKDL